MHFRVAIEILNKLRSKLGFKQYDITLTKKKKKKKNNQWPKIIKAFSNEKVPMQHDVLGEKFD